eukprot:893117-Prymnesium_polylepis.1
MQEKLVELQDYEAMSTQQASSQMPTQFEPPPSFTIPGAAEGGEDRYASEDLDKYLPSAAKSEQSPISYNPGATYQPPSRARQCFGKLQSGFFIGASLGGAFGFMYGAYASVVYRHILYLPIAVVQAGGAFGFFLACGTVIRCDEQPLALTHRADERGAAAAAVMSPAQRAMPQPRDDVAALA